MKITRSSLVLVFLTFAFSPLAAHAQYAGGSVGIFGFAPSGAGVSGGGGGRSAVATGHITSNSNTDTGEVLGASAYNFASDLHIGSTGADVTQLQTILIADGYLHISAATGYFGPLTKAAVMQYQAVNNIAPTGFVGPLTLTVLNAGSTPTAPEQPAVLRWIESTGVGKAVEKVLNWSAST